MEKWFLDLMVLETELRVREYSNETIKIYKALVEDFLDYVNKNALEIEGKDVEDYLRYQLEERKISNNTVMIRLNAIEFFLREVLGLEVTHKIERFQREYKDKELLSTKDIDILLNGNISIRNIAIYALAYFTGLSAEEIVSLDFNDCINEGKGSINLIVRHNGQLRIIEDLDKRARERLEIWMIERENLLKYKEEQALFINKNYTRITSRSLLRWLKFDLDFLEIDKDVNFSTLKYSRAYELALEKKYDEATKLLGYKDKDRLFRYFREIGIYIKRKG